MKIIKRNGSEVPFDITKIITAVTKASDSVGGKSRLTREQINQIADDVTEQCQALNRAVSVEEIQDMVENKLMDMKAHDIARHYITYRYIQSLKRQTNTTEERRRELVKECREYAEQAKVSIRNIRRDFNNKLERDEELTEDDVRREQAKVQKHTDEYVAKVEELLKEKEAEVMEI